MILSLTGRRWLYVKCEPTSCYAINVFNFTIISLVHSTRTPELISQKLWCSCFSCQIQTYYLNISCLMSSLNLILRFFYWFVNGFWNIWYFLFCNYRLLYWNTCKHSSRLHYLTPPNLLNGQNLNIASPSIFSKGTTPKYLESLLWFLLSPITNTWPSGTSISSIKYELNFIGSFI